METDRRPQTRAKRLLFDRSDALSELALPPAGLLQAPAARIVELLGEDDRAGLTEACNEFVTAASDFYGVQRASIEVLAARPRRVYRDGTAELYGDYDLESALIRVWMRTAVHKRVTSPGTFLSTLCHEFCHHLDLKLFGFPDTPHTRGFYMRTAHLYHHARQTPLRPLHWIARGGVYHVDWSRMRRKPAP
jgi:hypothetical protein